MGFPLQKDMGPVEVLWEGDGVPPFPSLEQPHTSENITSCRTTYAGGKKNNTSEKVQADFLPLTPYGFHSPCSGIG